MCRRCDGAEPDRRRFIAGAGALTLAGATAGCIPPSEGPVDIVWGRDTCEFCRMIISEARFAAQIRGGPKGRVFKFDDIGDAVLFLIDQEWREDSATEFWIGDSAVEHGGEARWLEARRAVYLPDRPSPMDYGFAALEESDAPEAMNFEAMVRAVAKLGPATHCPIPTTV